MRRIYFERTGELTLEGQVLATHRHGVRLDDSIKEATSKLEKGTSYEVVERYSGNVYKTSVAR